MEISGHNYRTKKAWRRMNQAIIKDVQNTPADVLLAELQSDKPSMFDGWEFPELSKWQRFRCKLRSLFWIPIDWFTDKIGYAVWISAKNDTKEN